MKYRRGKVPVTTRGIPCIVRNDTEVLWYIRDDEKQFAEMICEELNKLSSSSETIQ